MEENYVLYKTKQNNYSVEVGILTKIDCIEICIKISISILYRLLWISLETLILMIKFSTISTFKIKNQTNISK